MKPVLHCLFPIVILLIGMSTAYAQASYIRAGATGAGNGTDWSNAYPTLPATLVRGATYYIADGTYGGYTFDDATAGTTLITIKKATLADHGTDVGWQTAYGDGQAIFSSGSWQFTTSHWLIDGTYRTAPKGTYGFRIENTTAIRDRHIWINASGLTNITIRYVEVEGIRSAAQQRSYYDILGSNGITLSYVYIRNTSVPILIGGTRGIMIEHSVLALNRSNPQFHSEAVAASGDDNVTIRYNLFEDIEGTGNIVHLSRGGAVAADNWDIYGNVFTQSPGNSAGITHMTDGVIAFINFLPANNIRIFNNTFVGILYQSYSSRVAFVEGPGNNRELRNNLWVNSISADHNGTFTKSHNSYYDTPTNDSGVGSEAGRTGNPLKSGDYRLSQPTTSGATLGAPFNEDPDGLTRGSDSVWDRGAYEFGGGMPTQPSAPRNLRITP